MPVSLVAVKPVGSSTGTIEPGTKFRADHETAKTLVGAGMAEIEDGTAKPWAGIQWPGADVVILASGPSLTVAQCEQVREWRAAAPGLRRAIAINTTFRRALWADVLYACDAPWWRATDDQGRAAGFKSNHAEAKETFRGELWTQDALAKTEFGVRWIQSKNLPGLSKQPGVIHQGGNSGHQAINLAFLAGARRIILLGFDFQGTHWHGNYTNGLPNNGPRLYEDWAKRMAVTAADLAAEGVEVLNCSPSSAIQCFKKTTLGDALWPDSGLRRDRDQHHPPGSALPSSGI